MDKYVRFYQDDSRLHTVAGYLTYCSVRIQCKFSTEGCKTHYKYNITQQVVQNKFSILSSFIQRRIIKNSEIKVSTL